MEVVVVQLAKVKVEAVGEKTGYACAPISSYLRLPR